MKFIVSKDVMEKKLFNIPFVIIFLLNIFNIFFIFWYYELASYKYTKNISGYWDLLLLPLIFIIFFLLITGLLKDNIFSKILTFFTNVALVILIIKIFYESGMGFIFILAIPIIPILVINILSAIAITRLLAKQS